MNRVKKAIILCLLLPAMCLSLCACSLEELADLAGIGDLGNLVHIGDLFDFGFDFDFGSGSQSADETQDPSVDDADDANPETPGGDDIAVEMPAEKQ